MKFAHPFAVRTFNHFNKLCFGGKLPPVPIEMSNARRSLGQCVYRIVALPGGKKQKTDFRIRLSQVVDLPERELEDIVIHEMIHYYIDSNQFTDTSTHGILFQDMMNRINATFGRNITISHKSTKEEREGAYDTRPHWHVIAVLTLSDGKKGIKVLPRVLPSILKYYNGVMASPQVSDAQLYMSNDIYFNRFPNSSSLKYHSLEDEVNKSHLVGAEKMECDGHQLFRHQS